MFSSSNSALINVGVSMVLQDHFSGPAGNVVSSWNKMLGDIGTYQRGLTGAYTNNLNMGIGMINSMKEAFEYSAQVQKNTWLTNTMINDGMNHQADLMKSAQEINLRNPLTAQDITSGQKFMAMAGMTFDKIKEASEPAAQLAAIFDMDIGGKGGTADLMTNIMSTFNIEASRATEIADGMFTATTSANMSLQDLAQSIKYSASTAKIAGVDYQQLSAYIGVLGNRGIQGSMAGTNFAQAISQMLKGITGQTKTGGNAMKLMGLTKKDFTDAAGNALPLQEILQKVASATNHLNSVDRFSALQGLFGTRGLRAASILIEDVNNGSKEYLSLLNKIKGSTGTLDKSMQDYLNTPQGRIDTLNSAFENLKVNIGAALSNVFIPIMRVMGKVANIMDSISQSGFGKWLISGVGIGIFFGTARAALGFIKMSLRVIRGDFLSTASNATKTLTAVRGTGAASTALELHLRMCNELLQRMAFNSGVVGNNLSRAKNGQPFLPLGNGYRYSIDKNGNPRYTNAMGRVVPVGAIYGGNTAASAASVASGVKNMTHGAEVVNRARSIRMASMIGTSSRAIQTGIRGVSAGIGVLGTVGRGIMGFLGGPWGLAITAGISFLPMIFDWLQGDHRSEEEKRAAQEASEMARLEKAVRDGTLARIQVNINGQTLGTFTNGDTVSTNLPMSGGSDDSLYGF
jgi:TP901 family phage tail tape measure protein